jgi:predicted nucleic-acid-binding protein
MRVKMLVFVSEIILIGFVYFLIENKRNEKKKKDRFALILLTLSKF